MKNADLNLPEIDAEIQSRQRGMTLYSSLFHMRSKQSIISLSLTPPKIQHSQRSFMSTQYPPIEDLGRPRRA